MKEIVVYNGEFLTASEISIHPLNRGMMYGDGCFETLRSYNGRFLHLNDHYERLIYSLTYLSIDAPFSFSAFKDYCLKLISKNELHHEDAFIRIQCWREGERGYQTNSNSCSWILTSSLLDTSTNQTVSLSTVETPAIPNRSISRIGKFSNGINYIKASQEAVSKGYDDALMLTVNNLISETTIANIFWHKDGTYFTPSVECDLLPGITRNLLIDLILVEEGEFELSDILKSEAIFCTNSLRELRGVHQVNQHKFDPTHQAIQHAKLEFQTYLRSNLK